MGVYVEMDEDTWMEKFKPTLNTLVADAPFNGTMFETFGKEADYVFAQPAENVWTYISGDGDAIIQGRHFVNRMGYFVCETPWDESSDVEVPLEPWGDPEEDEHYCDDCGGYYYLADGHDCKKN